LSHDTWLHRIARVIVLPLAKTPVTPNHVTGLRLLTGIGAAALLALDDEAWMRVGAAVFLLSMVLDRADGDLARVTGRTTPGGHTFDLVSDATCNAAIFVGLGLGLRASDLGWMAIPMGLLAGASVTTILWLVMAVEAAAGARGAELGTFAGFDADDAMLLVPLALLLGAGHLLLVLAALGAPLFAAFMFWRFRDPLRRARSPRR
jgi:phosphatidylglycerophosphate synthase